MRMFRSQLGLVALALAVASCGRSDRALPAESGPEVTSTGAEECAPLQKVADIHHDTYLALAEDSSWPRGKQIVLDSINGLREPITELRSSRRDDVTKSANALNEWLEPAIDAAHESQDLSAYIEYMSESFEATIAFAEFDRLSATSRQLCGLDLVDPKWTSPARSFTDTKANVACELPQGWSVPQSEGLIDFFTSISNRTSPTPLAFSGSNSTFFAVGEFETTFYDPATEGLQGAARSTSVSFGEFLAPYEGQREPLLDKAITLDGQAAWQIRYRIVPDSDDDPSVIIDFVAIDAPISVYFLGVTLDSKSQEVEGLLDELDEIYKSARFVGR